MPFHEETNLETEGKDIISFITEINKVNGEDNYCVIIVFNDNKGSKAISQVGLFLYMRLLNCFE